MTNGRVREWIGPRIVPIFADDVQWDITSTYEPLMMVQSAGETYMTRQYVPAGIELPDVSSGDIANDYWVHMSNWNAQIEGYRAELQQYINQVTAFDGRITTNTNDITSINNKIGSGFDAENTVAMAIADIIAEIGNGFDDQNTVASAIADVIDSLGGQFDSENTVKDYIDAVDDKLGDSFSSENTVEDVLGSGFDSDNTVADAISGVETDLENMATELSGKIFTQPAWNIIDRFIIDETANTGETTGAQAGCYFVQENVRYDATMINSGGAAGCDTIRIRNIDSDSTVANFSIPVCHGLAIDYNPTTKELLYYDEVLNNINIVSVATITSPTVVLSISTVGTPMWWGVCWYSADKILVYREVNGDRICEIRERAADFNLIETIELEGFEHLQSTVYQDCAYKNGVFVVLTSFPEAVVMYELETGSLINVVNMPVHVGCSIIDEVEGITITDDSIYVEHPNNVDNVMVVTWLEWNFKRGTLKADESIHLWESSDTVGTLLVDWDTGSLRDPIGDNARTFKLAGDAENFAKMNYPNESIIISFQDDYPLYFRMEACAARVILGANDFPLGMRFSYMDMIDVDGIGSTTVGAPITIDHSVCKITGANGVTATCSNNIWSMNNAICTTNSQLDKLSAQYSILLAPSKPTNSTAWKCHWATPQDNWN